MRFYILLVVFLTALFQSGQAQGVWNLEKCIEHALSNNLNIKQSEWNIKAQAAAHKQSQINLLPSITANSNYAWNFGRNIDLTRYQFNNGTARSNSMNLQGNLILFSGFTKAATIKQRWLDLQSSKASVAEISNEITMQVAQSYLQVLLAEEQVTLAENQLKITLDQQETTRKLIDAGRLPEGNFLEANAQTANNEYSLIQAKNQAQMAVLNLKMLLNLDPTMNFAIERPNFVVPLFDMQLTAEQVYSRAYKLQPKILNAELQMKSAEQGAKMARGAYAPTLSVFGNISSNFSSQFQEQTTNQIGLDTLEVVSTGPPYFIDQAITRPVFETLNVGYFDQLNQNLNQAVGISLSIPILNGWQTRTQVEQASIQAQTAKINYRLKENELKNEVQQAYANAFSAHKQYEAAEKNLASVKLAFEYTKEKSAQGQAHRLDFALAQNNLQIAESNFLQAKYETLFRQLILDFYAGKSISLDELKK